MEIEKKSNGAFVGLVIIIIILAIGGVYIWEQNKKMIEENKLKQAQLEAISNQDANALDALEQDFQTADTNTKIDIKNLK